jgi:hypothetical protein
MLSEGEYLALRNRPQGSPAMHQSWRDLLFLHFSLPLSEVQPLLPRGLEIDTFPNHEGTESAWIGFVPFRMQDVRIPKLPAMPLLSAFPETNVRTYVHHNGSRPGIWFFSLDASRRLACKYARTHFHLPYFHAKMRATRSDAKVEYESDRVGHFARARVRANIGAHLPTPQPGSLEFFLVERYLLYASNGSGLFDGRVHHSPYSLRSAQILSSEQCLVEAAGLPSRPWEHVCFSAGVDVEVFPIQKIEVQRKQE